MRTDSACKRGRAVARISARNSNACAATSRAPRVANERLKRDGSGDVEHCPQCGGELKIIATIEEPAVIVRILTHLVLPARAQRRSPARLALA